MLRILMMISLCLITSIAHAATFVSVTPVVILDVTSRWNYDFSWRTSMLAPIEIVHTHKVSCTQPMYGPPDHQRPLIQAPLDCVNSETEARTAAQKDADKFEADRVMDGTSTTMIEAKILWKKVSQ